MEKAILKKFEEMDADERKKIVKVLQETKSSEDDGSAKKLEWLYKGDHVDHEEYLLGKRIDKAVTKDLIDEPPSDSPGALFNEVITRRSEMDMQVKMREDPLYAIRMKEEEAKRKLLENPVKMKHLQKMSSAEIGKIISTIFNKIPKKPSILKVLRQGHAHNVIFVEFLDLMNARNDTEIASISHLVPQIETQKEKSKKKHKKDKKSKKSHKKHRSSDDSDDELLKKYLAIVEQKKSKQAATDVSHEETSRRDRPREYGLIVKDKSKERHSERSEKRKKSESQKRGRRSKRSPSPDGKRAKPSVSQQRKLTAEEKEAKRKEMMENARARDDQRQTNVKRYREEDEREKAITSTQQDYDPEFIKPLMNEHASQSSIEERIKRNIYKVQRTKADLSKNFAKR